MYVLYVLFTHYIHRCIHAVYTHRRVISLWMVLCHCFADISMLCTSCMNPLQSIALWMVLKIFFTMMKWFLCFLKSQSKIKLGSVRFDFTLTFWRNEKVNYFCENIFVVYTSCLHTSQRYYPVNGVNKLYESTIICFAGVRKVYTTCIYTAYTLYTQSQRYIIAMVYVYCHTTC